MVEREEPERKQPKTITAEVYLDVLWTYILGLARAGVKELQAKPSAAEIDGSQTCDYIQIPLDITHRADEDECGSPLTLLGANSVALVITITYLTKWQDNILPTRPVQGHNVVSSR